ncbi:MAG TPA: hypothetical protein VGS27_04400 [Candidatus Sulfotelmatobacter sp.]|nr:hypothetical protein [Candidatus Sulfotelmatobacter sp.]
MTKLIEIETFFPSEKCLCCGGQRAAQQGLTIIPGGFHVLGPTEKQMLVRDK